MKPIEAESGMMVAKGLCGGENWGDGDQMVSIMQDKLVLGIHTA